MDREMIETKVQQSIENLKRSENKANKLSNIVGLIVFSVAILIIIFGLDGGFIANVINNFFELDGGSSEWLFWVVVFFFSLFLAVIFKTLVSLPINLFGERHARQEYLQAFSSDEYRKIADKFISKIPVRTSQKSSSIEMLPRLRRKLGIIIRRFRCSECNRALNPTKMGVDLQCPNCGVHLWVPRNPVCPVCGKKNTRIVDPQEQVPAIKTGEAAAGGALIYGPVGILAGGLLDAIYKPFKLLFRSARVAAKSYLYQCTECQYKWGVRLPIKHHE